MFTKRIGIDLGTANSLVWLDRRDLPFSRHRRDHGASYGGLRHKLFYICLD
ncbi:MAG: hypothetical protein UW22_C0005G0004 [Candidatus Gottesmanbacteria bacterium GW2011_GWB1_44_11c]|uniref:Uncharacterized protein n=2 Tax=Candidatus Gottesmaniibacteriota TaxID=1752720 RepID=A0A0G1IQH5_9BACT|nr:MAG: hypothetical protein UW22_C0005G0004 [Candidatus Gottesmanbacteria bacterium GW2011_GWB1_44_11c]KKT61203.1 MAG: hypothetical protein UW52_C0008G0009 [Candidatus Gottesmanbacteria bacterium GW2011_GWA1_44_24b]